MFLSSITPFAQFVSTKELTWEHQGICCNPQDNCIYFCDKYQNAIKKITLQGIIFLKSIIIIFLRFNYLYFLFFIGQVSLFATIKNPSGITVNQKENCLYVTHNSSISKITSSGFLIFSFLLLLFFHPF